jgi:hypothetical protein
MIVPCAKHDPNVQQTRPLSSIVSNNLEIMPDQTSSDQHSPQSN